MAEQVMRMPEPQLPRICACGGGCPKCRNERVQTRNTGGVEAPPAVRKVAAAPGKALDPAVRASMEARFGHDFSGVRVHADAEAAESALEVHASAYTVGDAIVFGAGRHEPGTADGQLLLAHELTHVIQQGAAPRLPGAGGTRVGTTAGGPRLQRQPLRGGQWKPSLVKPYVKDKDTTPGKEVWRVIEKNDLKGTPSTVRSAKIDGTQHEWRVTIKGETEGTASFPGPHGRTGNVATTEARGRVIHTIPITVNYILPSSDEEKKLFPVGTKDTERVNFMAARTLYHEVLHALIDIDRMLPEGEKTSQATSTHENLRARAGADPAVIAAKLDVLRTVSSFVSSAEATINVVDLFDSSVTTPYPTRAERLEQLRKSEGLEAIIPPEAVGESIKDTLPHPLAHPSGQRRLFLQDTMDTLISEKHARRETGKAFGLTDYASNKRIAEDYAKNIPKTIQEIAQLRSGNSALDLRSTKVWQSAEATLLSQVENFFAELDQPPKEPMPALSFDFPMPLPQPIPLEKGKK